MHALSGDSAEVRPGGAKPAESETLLSTVRRTDADHAVPPLNSARTPRTIAPMVPPGEFRFVDHGW